MSQLNAKEAELKRRKHVISVMHEKAQLDIGKELLRLFFGPFFLIWLLPSVPYK